MKTANGREVGLLALLGTWRYGRELREKYSEYFGDALPHGSLYTTLRRMEEKGLVRSRRGDSEHERGGNRRKYFQRTAKGNAALASFKVLARRLIIWRD